MAESTVRCPTCRKVVVAGSEDFPFCSERCRVIDLGKWASGEYRISSPVMDPELLDELESGGGRAGGGSAHRTGDADA